MTKITIGIDIGGTSAKFGGVNIEGKVLFQDKLPIAGFEYFVDFINELSSKIKIHLNSNSEFELTGIGIGAPHGNYYSGKIEYASNLPWNGKLPITDLLSQTFNVPIILTNDANAATIGEMLFGGARGMSDFVMITLGTGLGSGIVSNGQLIMGSDGFAGELGHVTTNYINGRSCKCGRKGCLETYVSATGIKRTVYKLLADSYLDSDLRAVSFNELSPEMITEHALKGDSIAIQSFEYTGRILGTMLAGTIHHTNPEAIFLFGGLSLAQDLILNPTKKYIEDNLMDNYKGKVQLLQSKLENQSAPIVGAGSLVWNSKTVLNREPLHA